jgi:hypothetical protein
MRKLFAWLGAALLLGCGSGSSGNNPNNGGDGGSPSQKDEATVDQGATSVKTRQCVSCHGQNMAGATTMIPYPQDARVELYPPNLTNDKATGIGNWTDDQLANGMRLGVDNNGLELCPEMQHFSTMNDYEAYSIVKYLRSIPPVSQKVLRSVCPPLKTKDEQRAAADAGT